MNSYVFVDPNQYDRFILRQRFKFVVNEYIFSLPGPDGESSGMPFCYVRQKPFKFKEDIRFYADETRTRELMRIQARQRFDPRARYAVTSADGSKVGEIQKAFGVSLFRSTYRLFDAAGNEVAVASEKNLAVALLRRLVGFIPYVENFSNWLPIPYHFTFTRDGLELGIHRRQLFKFHDTYTIDLSGDPGRTLDRRLILAIAVGMDALQAR